MQRGYPIKCTCVNTSCAIAEQYAHPVVGIDRACTARDVTGDIAGIARPEPDLDKVVVALHGVPSAAITVEGRAVRIGRARRRDATARVTLAVVAPGGSRHTSAASRHGTARVRVESDGIGTLVVNTFDLYCDQRSCVNVASEQLTISISPLSGQWGPVSQRAGQVPQP